MKNPNRLIPDWPFPPYKFVPGKNPHPKKENGHMEGQGDPVCEPIDVAHPGKSRFLLYALDLYNHGYYWESHVYFESLWNAHGRVGCVADFLKGMIKLGAAGVKIQIEQPVQAIEHFERAIELFESVKASEGKEFLGFDLDQLISKIKIALEAKEIGFKMIPGWNNT